MRADIVRDHFDILTLCHKTRSDLIHQDVQLLHALASLLSEPAAADAVHKIADRIGEHTDYLCKLHADTAQDAIGMAATTDAPGADGYGRRP